MGSLCRVPSEWDRSGLRPGVLKGAMWERWCVPREVHFLGPIMGASPGTGLLGALPIPTPTPTPQAG